MQLGVAWVVGVGCLHFLRVVYIIGVVGVIIFVLLFTVDEDFVTRVVLILCWVVSVLCVETNLVYCVFVL